MATPALTEAVYFILLSLLEPMHGYGIIQLTEKLSDGRVRLAAGTLYGAINTLLEKGWICSTGENRDSRKKEYVITSRGKEVLRGEVARLSSLAALGKEYMEEMRNENDHS